MKILITDSMVTSPDNIDNYLKEFRVNVDAWAYVYHSSPSNEHLHIGLCEKLKGKNLNTAYRLMQKNVPNGNYETLYHISRDIANGEIHTNLSEANNDYLIDTLVDAFNIAFPDQTIELSQVPLEEHEYQDISEVIKEFNEELKDTDISVVQMKGESR